MAVTIRRIGVIGADMPRLDATRHPFGHPARPMLCEAIKAADG
jgi:hypothetical protein